MSQPALGQVVVDDCVNAAGEAPVGFNGLACNSACSHSGDTLTCDLSSCGGGSSATAVHDFSGMGAQDFSIWGACNGTSYCCVVKDDTATQLIETFILKGSGFGDSLDFIDTGGSGTQLEPHVGPLEAIMQGQGGADQMQGSDYDGSVFYRDKLAGGDGGDTIEGRDGKDGIRGQDGNDVIRGGDRADRMDGGFGADDLEGGDGWDTYCDSAGATAATCEANTFDEGSDDGNDKLWLDDSGCASASGNLAYGDAGSGTDECGPSTWSPLANWSNCESIISNEPATCP